MQRLKIGYSPCPNDTFIFGAWANALLSETRLEIDPVLADVEELNVWAMTGKLDVTKLSYHAFYHVSDQYDLLDAGGALGRGNGPLLVTRPNVTVLDTNSKIAVPGMHTTACFLLQCIFPKLKNLVPILFSDIPEAVINGTFDAGLIIHESRFLYEEMGLKLYADLGERWEQKTDAAIPLGCIAVKKTLPGMVKHQINEHIKTSIAYATDHAAEIAPYIKQYAQELDNQVIASHIDMFVNDFSLSLGPEGTSAVDALFEQLNQLHTKNKRYTRIH